MQNDEVHSSPVNSRTNTERVAMAALSQCHPWSLLKSDHKLQNKWKLR